VSICQATNTSLTVEEASAALAVVPLEAVIAVEIGNEPSRYKAHGERPADYMPKGYAFMSIYLCLLSGTGVCRVAHRLGGGRVQARKQADGRRASYRTDRRSDRRSTVRRMDTGSTN
jgi:hypothetical protein